MKAVFFLQTDPFLPKPALRALREADALARAGWEVSFVSWTKAEKTPAASPAGPYPVRRIEVPVPALGTSFLGRAFAYRRAMNALFRAGADEGADLVVDHDLEVLRAAAMTVRASRKPLLYDSHEDWPALIAENSRLEALIARLQERRLCRQVAHVVTVSEPIAEKFRRMGKPTTVLYSARRAEDIHLADREASRAFFGYGADDFVIGFAGALGAGRGLELLLEAVARFPPAVHALIVGGPADEAARLRERANALRITDRVRIEGYTPFERLAPSYAAMDVGVILLDPRPNHQRALPNKLFDYMAHGVPVIVPRYPAMASVVGDSGSGLTLPVVSVPELTAAVEQMRSDPASRGAMATRARERFLDVYAWEHQEARFLRIVESVGLGGGP